MHKVGDGFVCATNSLNHFTVGKSYLIERIDVFNGLFITQYILRDDLGAERYLSDSMLAIYFTKASTVLTSASSFVINLSENPITQSVACECGAHAVGSDRHSGWCSLSKGA